MLLTLPGAALWSLPFGYWALMKLKVWWYMPVMGNWAGWTPWVMLPLVPISAVCSFMGMEHYAGSKSDYGLAVVMMMFNLITVLISSLGTFLLILWLFSLAF